MIPNNIQLMPVKPRRAEEYSVKEGIVIKRKIAINSAFLCVLAHAWKFIIASQTSRFKCLLDPYSNYAHPTQ
jgi:hypothetical protein